MADCGGCGAALNDEMERTTRRLLASLDDERRARLAETYQGNAPEVLCATCFSPTVAHLNRATPQHATVFEASSPA